jgi:hypothetical protein
VGNLFLSKRSEEIAMQPNRSPKEKLYSFVMLTTDGFKDRAAHLGASDANDGFDGSYQDLGVLCDKDLNNIKKEVLESNGAPRALRDYIESL